MKMIKWKILIVTCVICLLPVLLGVSLWEKLPDTIAIHFNIYGEPDNFTTKEFGVFGLPLLMVVFQIISCVSVDMSFKSHGKTNKFEIVGKWIIPVVTAILYIFTLGYSLGWDIDARKVAMFIVGGMFLVLGNYLPKLDYIKNYKLPTDTARKINRFIGYETVILGTLFLISIFLPPEFSIFALLLLIPYTIIAVVYGITTKKRK